MPIRDLVLTNNDPAQSLQELKFQWAEMAGAANEVLNKVTATKSGYLRLPEHAVSSGVSISTSLTNAKRTISVTTSGLTITLPAASAEIIGQNWTVHLGVVGYVNIAVAGADVFVLPTTETTIRLDVKGSSVTLRCLTTNSWGIV